jgi:signal transduction histidine kinase/CheY-like chemotaxis protein
MAIGSPKADVSVPIASHERVTYALIVALALLYFATGYTAYRSERAHAQLEEQRRMTAEQASKAKGDFLAKMSHELRTPMNGVISMTELAMGAANQAERQRCLCMVRQCANSLLTVINDVLDISKIEAGKLELCRVPLNVPECVINTLAVLASLAKDKGLSLRWGIAPDVPSVVIGDPGRLRQVLNNLIGNAIKFTSSGEVDVRVMPQAVHSDKTVLRFTVQDTGRGMSPQDQWRAFTPYYQCPDSQRYRKDSTGLGLAITKQLVELMGGRISVRSEIGKGSTFTFTIRFGPPIEEGSGLAKETLPSLTTIRALVVSAIPANLRRFRGALESWGAVPGSAEDSDAALLALKDAQGRGSPFALVLFDSSGSGMDPFDFAEELSTLEGYEGVALAVIHPAGLRGDAIRCLQTGIDVYLGIPIEDDQLHLALSMAVQHAASQKCLSLITRHTFLDARSLRILLVDDNPVNREAASMLMSQWGHKVQAACAGEEAVSISAEREFDLVLMDLEMPGISGIEATEQIRRREQGTGRRTPIVAMTAYALDSDRQRCLQAGMDEYLTKPFRPDQLRKLISAVSVGGVGRPIQPPSPANAPTPPADRAAWNPSEALRLADGNKKTVGIIVSTFLRDLRETLPAAQNAALTRDGKTLAKYAHRWKGSLGLLGAERSLSCAVKLEDACRSGEPERLLEYFQRLHEELLALEQALSSTEQDNVQCKSL